MAFREWVLLALTACALAVTLGLHTVGALHDFVELIQFPYEIDYGEGIVWQQAMLMGSADMYSIRMDLPFFIVNYPPLYLIAVRLVGPFTADLLQAGRLISATSTCALASLIALLVWRSVRPPRPAWIIAVAILAGLTVLCMASVRSWADLMRVDMLAFALAFAGLAIAQRQECPLWQTGVALLFCLAAVFTKQTAVAAGFAVAVTAFRHYGYRGLRPISIIGVSGIGIVLLLQAISSGGFLQNIVGYNINRLFLHQFTTVALYVSRDALVLSILIISAMFMGWSRLLRAGLFIDRGLDLPLTYFFLCTALLPLAAKSGSSVNYFIEWFAAGGVLCGLTMTTLLRRGTWLPSTAIVSILALGTMLQPIRTFPAYAAQVAPELPNLDAVIQRIADASKPVISENLALVVRAGKRTMFEPAILKELILAGRWDERPLVAMIEAQGFEFILTKDDHLGPNSIRTPAVDAAMRRAYPRVERIAQRLWINLPE